MLAEGQVPRDAARKESTQTTPGSCEWQLEQPLHGSTVTVSVDCVNEVQLHTRASSRGEVVLLQPPDMSKVKHGEGDI